jgi:hypothetical protein
MEEEFDNNWHSAIMQLKGYKSNGLFGWSFTSKCDPKPLAGLLMTAPNIPSSIIDLLAFLLMGGGSDFPKIRLIPPKNPKHFEGLINNLHEMSAAKQLFETLISEGKTRKQALGKVEDAFDKKRTWVEEAIKLDEKTHIHAIFDHALPESARRRVSKKNPEVF